MRPQSGPQRLARIEQLAQKQREGSFRLDHRQAGPLLADETEAHQAFAWEVAATLDDPIILRLIERGVLDN